MSIEIKAEILRLVRSNSDLTARQLFVLLRKQFPELSAQEISAYLIELID